MARQVARPSPFTQLTSALEWENLFAGMGIFDGVNDVPGAMGGTNLLASLDSPGRNVVLAPGKILIKGQLWSCDSNDSTAIPAASAMDRIDRVTLRLNRLAGDAGAYLAPYIIQGTPSSSPAIPDLVRSSTGNYDVPIARWLSAANGTLSGLVDERQFLGLTVCVGTSTNRPTIYKPRLMVETDTGNLMMWDGTDWNQINLEMPAQATIVTKPSFEGRSSTSFAVDSSLVIPLAGNSTYQVDGAFGFCGGQGTGEGDLKWTFNAPVGYSGGYSALFWSTSDTIKTMARWYDWTVDTGIGMTDGLTDYRSIQIQGIIITGGNSGNLQLKWAKNQSSSTDTRILAGSYLKAVLKP